MGIAGLGITCQMHGLLLVDHDHRPLTPFITWQDGRCLAKIPGCRIRKYLKR